MTILTVNPNSLISPVTVQVKLTFLKLLNIKGQKGVNNKQQIPSMRLIRELYNMANARLCRPFNNDIP